LRRARLLVSAFIDQGRVADVTAAQKSLPVNVALVICPKPAASVVPTKWAVHEGCETPLVIVTWPFAVKLMFLGLSEGRAWAAKPSDARPAIRPNPISKTRARMALPLCL
jgi:hypothetical protein